MSLLTFTVRDRLWIGGIPAVPVRNNSRGKKSSLFNGSKQRFHILITLPP